MDESVQFLFQSLSLIIGKMYWKFNGTSQYNLRKPNGRSVVKIDIMSVFTAFLPLGFTAHSAF